MASRIEQNISTGESEIVLDGWENGISDSPELGVADCRNINNDSIPGIALANYKLVNTTQPPLSLSFTSASSVLTLTSGSFANIGAGNYFSVKFTNLTGSTGLTGWSSADSTSNIYYATRTGPTTATIWSKYDTNQGVNTQVTLGTGAGTITTIDMGIPMGYAIDEYRYYTNSVTNQDGSLGGLFIIDNNGRVWAKEAVGFVYLVGNTLPSAGQGGNGIAFFNGYLFAFRNTVVDAYDCYGRESPTYSWTNGWDTASVNNPLYNGNPFNLAVPLCSHYAKTSVFKNQVYFCDGRNVDSLHLIASPANTPPKLVDFSITRNVLTLPSFELTSSIEEPSIDSTGGTLQYVGTSTSRYIYPWDTTTSGTFAALVMPEVGTYQMLNINKIVYILAGSRGNVYYTNGSSIILFKSLPKQPSGTPYPMWTWGGIMSLNNNLCFGASETSNGVVGNAGGCWAITLAVGQLLNSIAGAIRYKGQPSPGKYNTNLLVPFVNGLQYYAFWYNGTNGGMDYLDSVTPTFYSNYESYLESDIVPIGTALQGKTFNTIEFKLDTPLVSGEKVRISVRGDLSTAYTNVPFNGTTEVLASGSYLPLDASSDSMPIQYKKWIQVKAELQTVNGGSFVRLREIRIR